MGGRGHGREGRKPIRMRDRFRKFKDGRRIAISDLPYETVVRDLAMLEAGKWPRVRMEREEIVERLRIELVARALKSRS